ncbi:MAG TPA: hypothetical protein VGO67_24345 [Verrucomicrobiae bacterium]
MTTTDVDKSAQYKSDTAQRGLPSFAERFVLRALVVSLLLHLLAYATYREGQTRGWWANMTMPRWMQVVTRALTPPIPQTPIKPAALATQPKTELRFVQVDPDNAQKEAPKVPKFYGAQNTFAANPNVTKPSTVPDIRGKQDKFLKTTEEGKPKAQPPQPKPTVATQPQHEVKEVAAAAPKKEYVPGTMASAKPVEVAREGDGKTDVKTEAQKNVEEQPQPAPPRFRNIADAKEYYGTRGGQPTKQAGGVPRTGITSSVDVVGSAIGNYDSEFVDAVSARWNQLWDKHSPNGSGKVVLEFRLHPDGRITDMKVGQTEVSELMTDFCKQAIFDPAPYKPWPREMRLEIPTDYRDIQFTFYYEIE